MLHFLVIYGTVPEFSRETTFHRVAYFLNRLYHMKGQIQKGDRGWDYTYAVARNNSDQETMKKESKRGGKQTATSE